MSGENEASNNSVEAETTESSFAKELGVCKSCKQNLENKEGRLLFCLHSFCQQCIENFVESSVNGSGQGSEGDVIKCPVCGQSCRRKDVIVNKFITPGSSQETSQDADENKICTGCDEGDATSFCVECQEFLCDTCVNAHKRVKITKDHTIQPKDSAVNGVLNTSNSSQSPELYCTTHPKEPLKLFCETCDRLTCRDCQLQEHKDHKYYFVEEAGQKIKQILQKLQTKVLEKKNYVENARDLIQSRSKEIQDRQEKVSNDIKVFALKIISEVNKRGKQLLEDLNALCSAKKAQLDAKGQGIDDIATRLDYSIKFLEFALDKGSNEVLLYSKKVLINQLRNILAARCEVPNPYHKVDIRFQWESSFGTVHVPKQGMLLVDGINFHGLSHEKQKRLIQQGGSEIPPDQHHAVMSRVPPHAPYQNHQGAVHSMAPRPAHHHVMQQGLQQGNYPPQVYAGGRPMQGNPMYNPHQSATISSSHQRNMAKPGMFFPPQSQQHHQQHVFQQQQQQHVLQQQQQPRSLTLAQLQQDRMRRMQAGVSSTSVPPSPIVIQPMPEDNTGKLIPNIPQMPIPGGGAQMVIPRPGSSPHGSNTPSPQQVGSTTGTSPEHRITHTETRMKPESTERPSCSFTASPKSTQNSNADQRTTANSMSLNDFNFDQDPMSFIKNIQAEFDSVAKSSTTETQPSASSTVNSTATNNEAIASSAKQKSTTARSHSETQKGKSTPHPTATDTTVLSQPNPMPSTSQVNDKASTSRTIETPSMLRPASLLKEKLSTSQPASQSVSTGKDAAVIAATMPSSQESDPSEDWCAVCNNGGDLLCCDRCPKVFHLDCHVPTLRKAPNGEWYCNLCDKIEDIRLEKAEARDTVTTDTGATKRKHSSGLTDREQKVCERILLELYSNRATPPFHEPVSPSVPHYYEIIKHPMDMRTIKKRLRRSHPDHYQTIEDFLQDVQLVFTNCARYNAAESEMGVIGREVEQFFHEWVRKLLPYIEIQPVTKDVPPLPSGDGDAPPKPKARRVSASGRVDPEKDMEELENLAKMISDGEAVEEVLGLVKQIASAPKPVKSTEKRSNSIEKQSSSTETSSNSTENVPAAAETNTTAVEEEQVDSAKASKSVGSQESVEETNEDEGMADDEKNDPDYMPESQELLSDPESVVSTPKK